MTETEVMHEIQNIVNRWNMNTVPTIVAMVKIEELILALRVRQWDNSHK